MWWSRHQDLIYRIETGEEVLTEEAKPFVEEGKRQAARIEQKYGKESLELDPYEWILLEGKLSALSWVLGSEWVGSLDT